MRIFNEDKSRELNFDEIDRSLGEMRMDKLFVGNVAEPSANTAQEEYEDIIIFVPYSGEKLQKILNRKKLIKLKVELEKIKEDIEQEVFGLVRDDYATKKARAAEIVNELRVLEGKAPREVSS